MKTGGLGTSMTTAVAQTPLPAVEAVVHRHYGLAGTASRLRSERDELFLINAGNGTKYVLRFANPADDHCVISMQASALDWIAQVAPRLPVPRLVPNLDRSTLWVYEQSGKQPRQVLLSTYLEGRPLAEVPRSSNQRHAIGTLLAQLGKALCGFSHPGANHVLAWDIQRASSLHDLVPEADGADVSRRWDVVRQGLRRFETIVKHKLPHLRNQVIHGDFNPHNLLVSPRASDRIVGVLDFGDMVRTPLINDVAVAACYSADQVAPLTAVSEIVSAYHSVTPLRDEELDLLYDLIITRLCAAVTITEWRARRYPRNGEYILKNTAIAWEGLQRLSEISPASASTTLRQACHTEKLK